MTDKPHYERQLGTSSLLTRRTLGALMITIGFVAMAWIWLTSRPTVNVYVHDGDEVVSKYLPGVPDYVAQGTFKTQDLEVQHNAFMSLGTGHVGIGSATVPAYAPASTNWVEGYSTTDTDTVIIDDVVDNHTADLNTITIHNSGTFVTTAVDRNAIGLRIIMDPLPTSGLHLLNNTGLYIDTNNGNTNEAIHVRHGTARFDEDLLAGNTTIDGTLHTTGNFDVNTTQFTVSATTGNVTALGLMTLSNTTASLWTKGRAFIGGTTQGDTVYISGGSVNFGFGNNATDKLHINFTGYNGGFSQFRDIEFDDGQGNEAMYLTGSSKSLKIDGGLDVVGLIGATNQAHFGAQGIQINSFSGTLVQPVIRSFAANPNGTVTGGIGSLLMDTSGPYLWQNTDGATTWTKIGGFTTAGSVYYGDGSDGTCSFDGVTTPVCGATLSGSTYTQGRDVVAMNATVATGVIVKSNNQRFLVYNALTLTGTGKLQNSGANATTNSRLPGTCGGPSTFFYAACNGNGGAGANGPGNGNNTTGSGTAPSPQWSTQAASAAGANGGGHGQGGGGGSCGANVGGQGGSISPTINNVGAFTAVSAWSGKADNYGNNFTYGTGGGGGGCTGGSCEGGGGGGPGGIIFVGANQCSGTGTIESVGGNGSSGALVGGTCSGGGAGAGGGVVTFAYSHRSGCAAVVTGGTGGAALGVGGAAGGNGSSGSALVYNLSGDGS